MDPTSLIAAGMIALVFGVSIFSDDDDSDSNGTAEPTLDPETGTVTGTNGNDVIDLDAVNNGTDTYTNVFGGAGNDTVDAENGGSIHGESGNDVLTVIGDDGGVTDGGTGNDVLNVTPISSDILGGEGNDTINYDGSQSDPDDGNTIDAGAGDDVIDIVASVETVTAGAGDDTISVTLDGDPATDNGRVEMGDGDDLLIVDGAESRGFYAVDGTGNDTIRIDDATANPDYSRAGYWWIESGEGNDVYEVTLRPDAGAQHTLYPLATGYASIGALDGFEAGIDRLVVDPYSLAGDATYIRFEKIVASGSGHQQIVFHYTHPDYPDGLAMAVAVPGAARINLEDVEIVGAPTPASTSAPAA